jgi:N-acetylneuraminate synthase
VHHVPLVDERGHLWAIAIDESDTLRIGAHEIGDGHPAFVIAEVGNNHNGSVDLASGSASTSRSRRTPMR